MTGRRSAAPTTARQADHHRFHLVRLVDHTGVTGTGVVAQGIRFSDGTVVVRWLGDHASTVVWSSIESAVHVHGHGGHTTVEWIDQ